MVLFSMCKSLLPFKYILFKELALFCSLNGYSAIPFHYILFFLFSLLKDEFLGVEAYFHTIFAHRWYEFFLRNSIFVTFK